MSRGTSPRRSKMENGRLGRREGGFDVGFHVVLKVQAPPFLDSRKALAEDEPCL